MSPMGYTGLPHGAIVNGSDEIRTRDFWIFSPTLSQSELQTQGDGPGGIRTLVTRSRVSRTARLYYGAKGSGGLEPAFSGSKVRRTNQVYYDPKVSGPKGI